MKIEGWRNQQLVRRWLTTYLPPLTKRGKANGCFGCTNRKSFEDFNTKPIFFLLQDQIIKPYFLLFINIRNPYYVNALLKQFYL